MLEFVTEPKARMTRTMRYLSSVASEKSNGPTRERLQKDPTFLPRLGFKTDAKVLSTTAEISPLFDG
jgi:hypothetical protein